MRRERTSFVVELDLGIEAIHEDEATGIREQQRVITARANA
jgi:hypothetical protein